MTVTVKWQTLSLAYPGGMADDDGGLRARKRLAAMLRIQEVALPLFEQRGFDRVTVEEIAAASEVSPSSVYRYFGTKEDVVLWDEFDPSTDQLLTAALCEDVPLDGIRRVVLDVIRQFTPEQEDTLRRRAALMMSTPGLEQAFSARMYEFAEHLGNALADRLGRPMVDLDVQVFSHALAGGMLGMLHHWHGTGAADPLLTVAERMFLLFEEGLDLVTAKGDTP